MSIIDEIIALEARGSLVRFEPTSRKPLKRRLFLAEDAVRALNDPSSATNQLTGKGAIMAALEKWVRGGLVHGYKDRGMFLKRLDGPPAEIWEVKVTEPVVQSRLLGRFAYADTLVLTHFYTRQLLGPRTVRGKPSRKWSEAMNKCEATWNQLFPAHPPATGRSIRDFVTENCDDFSI